MFPDVKLEHTTTSYPVTLHFRPAPGEKEIGGWTLVTVNDVTGELLICSDYGNWAFRWNICHLGNGATLTQFLSRSYRDGYTNQERWDYVAMKLLGSEAYEFDSEATTKDLRTLVLDARREERLCQATAREYWDELDDLEHRGDPTEYATEYYRTEVSEFLKVNVEAEYFRERKTSAYQRLIGTILPAMGEALEARLAVAQAIHQIIGASPS